MYYSEPMSFNQGGMVEGRNGLMVIVVIAVIAVTVRITLNHRPVYNVVASVLL